MTHPGTGLPGVALVVVTLGVWAAVRAAVRRRLPHRDQGSVAGARLWRVNLTGSTAMLAGMALMIM